MTQSRPEPKVIVIPAKEESPQDQEKKKNLRVAAYCRVSTKKDEQLNSYENQKAYYTEKIMANPDWTMADIFADEGITGTSACMPTAFVYGNSFGFVAYATTILIAGTMFIMWLGEKITDKGIGNGISLIIMIGIVARLPHALLAEVNARFQTASGSAIMLILELVLLFLVFMATIALVQAVRKVPVQYAKRIVGNKQYGGVRQYIPLKMNAANVMPIIFAQALMFIPALFSGTAFAAAFSSMTGFWYNFTLAVLVIAFTYFYTAIIINPQMMADDMKRNGGFIPGVKPGKQTVNYIDTIMTRITLPGSFFLAIVAILPALAMKFLGIQQSFAYFYGGTSLLIMVGVVLDTLKQIESYLLMRHYDGLMKTGRIQGRH